MKETLSTLHCSKEILFVTEHRDLADVMHYSAYHHPVSPLLGKALICFLKDDLKHNIYSKTFFIMTAIYNLLREIDL